MSEETYQDDGPQEFEDQILPDQVLGFVSNLNRRLQKRAINEIQNCYEHEFNKWSDRFYKTSSWPTAESIAHLVDNNETFLTLYKELFFRHVYARLQPTIEDRVEGFNNYISLFNIFLAAENNEDTIELPALWVWDMIDEFIYQFQGFHIYRHKVQDLAPEEKQFLKSNDQLWSVQAVAQVLQALVAKAGIDRPREEGTETPKSPTIRNLGYFALVGLLRLNCLLTDYAGALKALDFIDLRRDKPHFTQVLTCHLTLYYYMGFAYLMTRRYVDSIKIFSFFLNYIRTNRQQLQRSNNVDVINKRVEQMFGLLAIAHALHPENLDDNISNEMRIQFGDMLERLRAHELSAIEEVFTKSCPKFITVSQPDFDVNENTHTQAVPQQRRIFLSDVQQRVHSPDVLSHLKLFSSISFSRLAEVLKNSELNDKSKNFDEDLVHQLLLKIKHKTRNLRWIGGSPNEGKWLSGAELEFVGDKDTIHVSDQAIGRRYGEFFIKNILRFEETYKELARK